MGTPKKLSRFYRARLQKPAPSFLVMNGSPSWRNQFLRLTESFLVVRGPFVGSEETAIAEEIECAGAKAVNCIGFVFCLNLFLYQ